MTAARSFQDWLDWQETLHCNEIELGLDRIAQVWRRLGLGKPAKTVITVAGTNGKGSCIALLESIMAGRGLHVAAYTSPHLLYYNERLRMGGVAVADPVWCQAFERVEQARGEVSLTYYEFGTLAALQIMAASSLDLALLEVGLGGRLDAVNIIDADCALLSQIGIDHVDWLGSNRELIGHEKAGIFRPGAIAVCGDTNTPESVRKTASRLGCRYYERGIDFDLEKSAGGWNWHGPDGALLDLALPGLRGDWQLANAGSCLLALTALGLIDYSDHVRVAAGLAAARLPGRLQILDEGPQILVDVAHNADSMLALCRWLKAHPVIGRTRVVFAALADKNIAEMAVALGAVTDDWYLAGLALGRGLSATELQQRIDHCSGATAARLCRDVDAALQLARNDSAAQDRIVVCGSFHTVAAAISALRN
jgi:dihydrofolate synthase/folylpolyglutamate synthase